MRLRVFAPVLAVFFSGLLAHASTITYTDGSGQVASGVNGLLVDGITYNVSFQAFAADPTFQGDEVGATDAFNALIAALNTSTAAFVNNFGAINNLTVQYAGNLGLFGTSYSQPHNWQLIGNPSGNNSVAVFAQAASVTPEPSSLVLLGTGVLAAIGAVRRRLA